MHQKKRKLFVLYSIPIWFRKKFSRLNLCNKEKLYLVSYSIPLSCMVVLLLGFGMMISPSSALRTNALEADGELDAGLSKEKDETTAEEAVEASVENANITPREIAAPSVTFEIGGAGQNEVVETSVDEVAYRSHTVRVSLNNVDEYFLFISGNTNLVNSAGGIELTGTGNAGVAGSNIPAGQWGYGWDYTGAATNADMTYKTVPTAQTKLTVPALSNNAVSFNGKLNFAAKFPTNATLGNYASNVNLTLIASPKAQTGSVNWKNEAGGDTTLAAGTETMQGVQPGFCKNNSNVKEGWTVDLTDNRDGNSYTVVKLRDGNCWMQQNLRLGKTTAMLLASGDTDLTSGTTWTLPAAATSWDASSNAVAQTIVGSTSLYSGWKTSWGNYYSWCAATAGTCASAVSDGAIASDSICPKGWKLPTGGKTNSANQFYALLGANGANIGGTNASTATQKIMAKPYLFFAAGAFFETNGSLGLAGTEGYYWSSTASSSTYAYNLYFYNRYFYPGTHNDSRYGRYHGYSMRCVSTH